MIFFNGFVLRRIPQITQICHSSFTKYLRSQYMLQFDSADYADNSLVSELICVICAAGYLIADCWREPSIHVNQNLRYLRETLRRTILHQLVWLFALNDQVTSISQTTSPSLFLPTVLASTVLASPVAIASSIALLNLSPSSQTKLVRPTAFLK